MGKGKYADGSILYTFSGRNKDGSDHTCEIPSEITPKFSLKTSAGLPGIADAEIDYESKFERIRELKPETIDFESARKRLCISYGRKERTLIEYRRLLETLENLEFDYLRTYVQKEPNLPEPPKPKPLKEEDVTQVVNEIKNISKGTEVDIEAIEVNLKEGRTLDAESLLQDKYESEMREAATAGIALGTLLFRYNSEGALGIFKMATQLDPINGEAWNNLGHIYKRRGDIQLAEEAYRETYSLGKRKSNSLWIAKGAANLGSTYFHKCKASKALDLLLEAQSYFEDFDDDVTKAKIVSNIGNIYLHKQEYNKAKVWYEKTKKLLGTSAFPEVRAGVLNNLGLIYLEQGDLMESQVNLKEGLEIFSKHKIKEGMAVSNKGLGSLALKRKQWDEAKKRFEASLKQSEDIGYKRGIAQAQKDLALYYSARGDTEKAKIFSQKSMANFNKLSSPCDTEEIKNL